MDRVPRDLIKKLNLISAIEEEVEAPRNLIPQEPWKDAIKKNKSEVAKWIEGRLSSSHRPSPSVVMNARKVGHGIRPVPTLGIAERITYRALTKHILRNHDFSRRTREEYLKFIVAPVMHAIESITGRREDLENGIPLRPTIGYVLEADISSFYQYIDHEILRRELELQTGETESIALLLQLISEVEGRSFGLPQLLEPSDWLSEIYITIVERDLIRKGRAVWRFNDDFRIGCLTYSEALDNMELLAEAARPVGLVIADHKTRTYTIRNYIKRTTNSEPDQIEANPEKTKAQATIDDYIGSNEVESTENAAQTLKRIELDPENTELLDLKRIRGEDVRLLRRAVNSLTRHENDNGLSYVSRLFEFVPTLTPELIGYLIAIHPIKTLDVEQVLDTLCEKSLSDWQALWIIYASRILGIAKNNRKRIDWIKTKKEKGKSHLVRAEAELTLAAVGATSFGELDQAIRMEPEALNPWYVLAIKELDDSPQKASSGQMNAIKSSSPLYKWLIEG